MTTSYKVSEIAKALDLSARRVQQLVKENILPAPIRGSYDLAACIRSYEQYLQERQIKNLSSSDLASEKLRLLKAQADKAELEVQILEEKYIAANEVEQLWSGLAIAFRAKMLALPTNLARHITTLNNDYAAIASSLQAEINAALLELSNYRDEQDASFREDSKVTSTTAKTNSKRVGG